MMQITGRTLEKRLYKILANRGVFDNMGDMEQIGLGGKATGLYIMGGYQT